MGKNSYGEGSMSKEEAQAWQTLITARSTTCLRNCLKKDLSVELHDMITKEIEVREV